ncbi:MAG: family 20 glycosylhydrolase, partial [Muribaculaceae bacterium]
MNRNLILCAALACAATLSAQSSIADVNKDNYVNYPDGNFVYQFNSEVFPKGSKLAGTVWDNVFPTPKQVTPAKGVTSLPKIVAINADEDAATAAAYLTEKLAANAITASADGKLPIALAVKPGCAPGTEGYTLTVGKQGIDIAGTSPEGLLNGVKTLIAAIETAGTKLPNVAITDYPDLGHRGFMLDIARNFTSFEGIKNIIDYIAAYKVNVFHLHLCDDESWALEIPAIPELTEVGAVREKTYVENNSHHMSLVYNGYDMRSHMKRTDMYITRAQFIELLKYAKSRGVSIIPEVDTPGHCHAAVVALKARYEKYAATNPAEAERFRIWDPNDTSKFVSAQYFTDNVINIALPGTYRFMETVFDEILAMYREAGVKLETYHFGGDEVAHGALEGSPEAKAFMELNGLKSMHELSEFYVDRMSAYIAMNGVKAAGWQEAGTNHSADFNRRVAPRFGVLNTWNTNGNLDVVPYTLANDGYPVVLSNVRNFYFDMAYTPHQDEQGLRWGGWCSEYTAFSALPYNTYCSAREGRYGEPIDLSTVADGKPTLARRENIVGVQSQIWSETIRNDGMIERYTFPRIIGMAERGWNASPAWGEGATDINLYKADMANFNLRLGTRELPRLQRNGVDFHINQPG